MEALLERCLPPLKRWAHERLPAAARGHLDTGDLVQEASLHVLGCLDRFEPRHVGAMQAYLRQSVINRIRDEVRRIGRNPHPLELPEDLSSDRTTPLEAAIQIEAYERYRQALSKLSPKDREMIVARIEVQWSLSEITQRFGLRTVDAARMAVSRAVKRLTQLLHNTSYSYLSASIGSSRAARIAGYMPKKIPTVAEKPSPRPNDHRGSEMGNPVT
jgi:RNA polymerase sigma-70 factor (ECF subfamily)